MIKKFLFLLLFSSVTIGFSQINNISPYSYFGIGDTNQQKTISSINMGGINVAQQYSNQLNFSNPASLSLLNFTTLSVAGGLKYLKIDDGTQNQTASHTALSSLAFGVPIGKKGGLILGLQPNTSVGYSIIEEVFDSDGKEVLESTIYRGNGGTNRFFGSFGYQVIKGLSLGIEGEFLFGNIENNIYNQRKDVALATRYRTITSLQGSSLKLGAQYHHKLKNNLKIDMGLSYKLKNKLNETSESYLYSFTYGINGEIPRDTTENNKGIKGELKRPGVITSGLSIGKPYKWSLGIEYENQPSIDSEMSTFTNRKLQYSSKSRYSIGGFYIPKVNSITNYWQRVVYQAGLKYENTGLSVNTSTTFGEYSPINDFGISFGLGLPIGSRLSQINLGFEFGKRGNMTNGLIKENYFNLRLSLNLVEKWFQKYKIN
jgi:hypothetical protein